MHYVKPTISIDDVKSNIDLLNEGLDKINAVLSTLPYNHMIDIQFQPKLSKLKMGDIRMSCSYNIICGNNESEWCYKENYTMPVGRTLSKHEVDSLGDHYISINFDLLYSIKRKSVDFKLQSIYHPKFKNEANVFKRGYVVAKKGNNVYDELYSGFGWGVGAKSRASVKRRGNDIEWLKRTLAMIIDSICIDSVLRARQAVNVAQTGKALSILK